MTDNGLSHTKRKSTAKKNALNSTDETKNGFLRKLQHELKTPIVGITSIGQKLQSEYDQLTDEERRFAVKAIGDNSERLNMLINNVLDLSRLSSGNVYLDCKKTDLSRLVHERVEYCAKLYGKSQNKDPKTFFKLDIQDSVQANCDEYYLTRVIDNIIINAIQYCQEGKITISLIADENRTIIFTVTDQGIGIPHDELDKIFEPFVVSSRTRTAQGGRGVGLAVAKKIISLHKGQIWAENCSDGASVSFTFSDSLN